MTNMRLNVGAVKQRFMLGATPVECYLQKDELARKIALLAQYPFTSAEDLFEALHLTSITLHDTDRMRRFLAEFRTPFPGIVLPLEFSWDPMARAYTDQRSSRGQSSRPQSLTRDVSHERQRGRTPAHVEAVEAAARVQVPDREEVPLTMQGATRTPSGKSQKLPGEGCGDLASTTFD